MRLAVFLFTSLALLSGCGDDTPEAANYGPVLQIFESRGIYLGTRLEGQKAGFAGFEHEDIPGFMDAMKMDYELTSPDLVEGIERGDKVSFSVIDTDAKFLVNRIELLPDTTTLLLRFGPTAPDSTTN